ncbi:GNAT family N-acetyltransferase [Streptomyces hoynatensis]|uniref:GNAT family N-acetyltransferase n=1 Tax=Streptomyces hoynatensis TaxID=1141874 RepID=A0A3A9YQV1_9ACTN|nr:GNAT family N-acetyltransferase [Streptomyces hoynatensis]RKN37626.1 GNAT family N-acetyltransferase [Streptomyces hoynatensis]
MNETPAIPATAPAPATPDSVVVRRYRSEDAWALDDVCIRTGHLGGDARGHLPEPEILPVLFAAPYAAHDPDLVFVADDGERPIGYLVGTADSPAYFAWFRREWLPTVAARFPSPDAEPGVGDANLRDLLHHPERMLHPEIAAAYPAHLHIDLLPQGQRRGLGRALMEAYFAALRERGVPGVHLSMVAANTNARAFYHHIGFHDLGPAPDTDEVIYLGLHLT